MKLNLYFTRKKEKGHDLLDSSSNLNLTSFINFFQVEDSKINEFEIWHGLANLYASLSHWKDAEICLHKAKESKRYSAASRHTEGKNRTFNQLKAFYLAC